MVVGRNGTVAEPKGIPVFAYKGESLEEYWDYTSRALDFGDGQGPTQIVDDGGDATLLIHKGVEFEKAGKVPGRRDRGERGVRLRPRAARPRSRRKTRSAGRASRRRSRACPKRPPPASTASTRWRRAGTLLFPAINVNDSVTKSKFDNLYGCRHSLIDGILRASDVMLAGKVAVVCGYGEVGKGCAQALRGQGARVIITEIDPICALQAAMEGYQVTTLDDVVGTADIFVTATGNFDIITAEHMSKMKDKAIVGNIGHFDNEIDMAGLKKVKGIERTNIKPQFDEWVFPDGHSVLILAEGRLLNLGLRHRPPLVRDVLLASPTRCMAQVDLAENAGKYESKVFVLPKKLDEKVARLHLDKLGVKLTQLTPKQASYIGVSVDGPYKPEHYRY